MFRAKSSTRGLLSTWRRFMSTEVDDGFHHTITLFTKAQCSQCVPVKEAILAAKAEYNNFRYQEIHIDQPEWKDKYYKQYRYDIPVVHIDNFEYCRHQIEDFDDFFETVKQQK